MLRGPSNRPTPPGSTGRGTQIDPQHPAHLPPRDQPFTIEERPSGIRFYQIKGGFWLPYHTLQCIEFAADKLKLTFITDEVLIFGHGLHELYVRLARQTIGQIIEQGERYAEVNEAPVFIARIERAPNCPKAKQNAE